MNNVANTRSLSISYIILMIISFNIAFVLSANIVIPFNPVPFTLQTMMLMLAIFYNKKIAFYSISFYVLLGSLGLPLFASYSGGVAVLFGPTGGYLIGFIIATFLIKNYNINNKFLNTIIFNIIVFGCGVLQLGAFITLKNAFYNGLIIFLIPECIKMFCAYVIYKFITNNKNQNLDQNSH